MRLLYTSYREEPRQEEKENGTDKREGKGHLLEKDNLLMFSVI